MQVSKNLLKSFSEIIFPLYFPSSFPRGSILRKRDGVMSRIKALKHIALSLSSLFPFLFQPSSLCDWADQKLSSTIKAKYRTEGNSGCNDVANLTFRQCLNISSTNANRVNGVEILCLQLNAQAQSERLEFS